MTWHPKQDRRIDKLLKLNDASGEKYCWAQLAYLAMAKYSADEVEEQKEACRRGDRCKEDSKTEGSCWCNKFIKGVMPKSPEEYEALLQEDTP